VSVAERPADGLFTRYADAAPYRTRDGSLIRELMHPARHASQRQSLAEAEVAPGQVSALHRHRRSEEVYHVTSGQGEMTLGGAVFPVGAGDTVCIPAGVPHRIRNIGAQPLRILCCCSPPYAHEDTELL
jgi:mannose-6-phosphate isomerase-like protein (cupin superfamily)